VKVRAFDRAEGSSICRTSAARRYSSRAALFLLYGDRVSLSPALVGGCCSRRQDAEVFGVTLRYLCVANGDSLPPWDAESARTRSTFCGKCGEQMLKQQRNGVWQLAVHGAWEARLSPLRQGLRHSFALFHTALLYRSHAMESSIVQWKSLSCNGKPPIVQWKVDLYSICPPQRVATSWITI
jgi:hypothetical protein